MSLNIGIDFDNTIACYDKVFCEVAQTLGLLEAKISLSKRQVKQALLETADGDISWQKLQGKVYGKYMHLASMFPGFLEFLYLAKLQGHNVFIVSHKSEYGHFDEERISLRDAAREWMQQKNIEGTGELQIKKENIFFASTRELKVKKIQELKCDYFIDDLVEVFDEPSFPQNTHEILFDTQSKQQSVKTRESANSWRELTKKILVEWSESDIVAAVKNRFSNLDIETAEIIKGRGNSRIYRLDGKENNYALKIYPDLQLDSRARLETEFAACNYLCSEDFSVMQAADKDHELNWAVYRWVAGKEIVSGEKSFLDEAINFTKKLYDSSQNILNRQQFINASEACLSVSDIVKQINRRLDALSNSPYIELNVFIQEKFLPLFSSVVDEAKSSPDKLFVAILPEEFQILSPSDFGSHNAIQKENGEIVFIDFEYFGWDDPVKFVSDFYWHPGVNLSKRNRELWIDATNEIFHQDPTYQIRLSVSLPLYALRWCLIILNEFLPEKLANRLKASNQDETNIQKILERQLNKSKLLLNQVIEDIPNYGSALQIS